MKCNGQGKSLACGVWAYQKTGDQRPHAVTVWNPKDVLVVAESVLGNSNGVLAMRTCPVVWLHSEKW